MNTIENAIKDAVTQAVKEQLGTMVTPERQTADRGMKIKGIRGLASYLEISTCTAQSLKNNGKLPFYEIGNRVFFFTNEVDTAIWKGQTK